MSPVGFAIAMCVLAVLCGAIAGAFIWLFNRIADAVLDDEPGQ